MTDSQSWWIGVSYREFFQIAKAQIDRMRISKFGYSTWSTLHPPDPQPTQYTTSVWEGK